MNPPPDYVVEMSADFSAASLADTALVQPEGERLTFSAILSRQAAHLPISDAMVRSAGAEMGSAELLSVY